MKKGKILAICLLVVTLSLTIGSIVFANTVVTDTSNNNVVMQLDSAKKAQAHAENEVTVYRQALKKIQLNYWIAFLVVLSLSFLATFMIVVFIQSRKKLQEKATNKNV